MPSSHRVNKSFLVTIPPDLPQQEIPALFLYLLNIFAKCLISQFLGEVAIAPKTAKTIGITGGTIFSQPDCQWHGHSMIDIFLAKYHRVCPVLFGISGSEKTKAGRIKLGWSLDPNSGGFSPDQQHYDRMAGMGAGFAAITLRDFSKSKNTNPAPNRIYWQALARILNTPAPEVQPTHFVVLKAMIDQDVARIIKCFGGAGIALLRQALITFPADKGPQDDKGRKIPPVQAVQALPAILQQLDGLALLVLLIFS